MRLVILLLALLLVATPLSAQEELPPGCNTAAMGTIFSSLAAALAQQSLPLDQAIYVIDVLQDTLAALRSACEGETWSDPAAPDYDSIPQLRGEDGAFILGDPAAPVTIIEFSDFLCPACQRYHETLRQLIQDYVVTGQARFEYRMFPVIDTVASPLVASLVECSEEQIPGSFWHAHDLMFELVSAGFHGLTHFTFASRAGLDYEELGICINETANQVVVDSELAQELGVSSTPTLMLRYGDGDMEFIRDQNGNRAQGGLPYFILESIVREANAE
ncbi:MAG: thioredoxin domain-containing protein [Anaerolineaceae bacterium]|nr:thioredoxin domain-containing protein [Anaerolineaceae bacterium]